MFGSTSTSSAHHLEKGEGKLRCESRLEYGLLEADPHDILKQPIISIAYKSPPV
jgi:hypothetical protein